MNRRLRKAGIALLGLAVVAAISVTIFLVVGVRRWPDGTIFVPRDFATVQLAVDHAVAGGTIVLQSRGEPFKGPVSIDVPELKLIVDRAAVLEADGTEPALAIRADGVTLRGLDIVSESIGIRVESARCRIEDIRVSGAPIGIQLRDARASNLKAIDLDVEQIGIELVSSGGNLLADITVRGADQSGLTALASWENVIERIVVSDAPMGILIEQGSTENELRDCLVERSSNIAVGFRGANDNKLVRTTIRGSGIGVLLEGATGNEIVQCEIEESSVAGLSFRQAVRNRAIGSAIHASQDDGILLSQSAENALSYNRIENCGGAGIRLAGSDRNLVIGSWLVENTVAIEAEGCRGNRILRNSISSSRQTGIVLSGGSLNSLFDNRISGGEMGVVLAGSPGNTLLRNWIEDHEAVGLCLLDGSRETSVSANRLLDGFVGILIVASSRSEVLNNDIVANDTGMLLLRSGTGIRIEGNTIRRNRIGLRHTGATSIEGIPELPIEGGEIASPIAVNNVFAESGSLDIANETGEAFYAGGNWWGGVKDIRDANLAMISNGVTLEGSAWRGTVAIGTEGSLSQEILGRILQHVLVEAGFRVIDLIGMGDENSVHEALRAQDVDLAIGDRGLASGISETEGDIEALPIPATRGWTSIVSSDTADRLSEATLSSFAGMIHQSQHSFRYAVSESLSKDAATSLEAEYGLTDWVDSVNWAHTLEETEVLLKFGAVEMAIVDSLEEVLTASGFVALEDDLGVFGSEGVVVALRSTVRAQFPELLNELETLAAALTSSVVHDLSSRVRLLQRRPEMIVREYLVEQGVLAE